MSDTSKPQIQAFPGSDGFFIHGGMSLRDYFAGQALAGKMANGATVWTLTINECYQAADLMLEARGK